MRSGNRNPRAKSPRRLRVNQIVFSPASQIGRMKIRKRATQDKTITRKRSQGKEKRKTLGNLKGKITPRTPNHIPPHPLSKVTMKICPTRMM